MSQKDKPNRLEKQLIAIKQGAQDALAGGKTVRIKGVSRDASALVALVDAALAPYEKVHMARALESQGVAERRAGVRSTRELVQLVRLAFGAEFGVNAAECSKVGFEPRKRVWNDAGNAQTRTERIEVGTDHRRRNPGK